MVFGDSVDHMVDGIDDLFDIWWDPLKQAIKLAQPNTQGAAGEIIPEENFKAAQYGTELGAKTVARYCLTYLIPKRVALTTPGGALAFKASADSVALYE